MKQPVTMIQAGIVEKKDMLQSNVKNSSQDFQPKVFTLLSVRSYATMMS